MADGPEAVSPVLATGGPPTTNGLGFGSAAAIESVLRGRLQSPGHSGVNASLPTAQGIAVV